MKFDFWKKETVARSKYDKLLRDYNDLNANFLSLYKGLYYDRNRVSMLKDALRNVASVLLRGDSDIKFYADEKDFETSMFIQREFQRILEFRDVFVRKMSNTEGMKELTVEAFGGIVDGNVVAKMLDMQRDLDAYKQAFVNITGWLNGNFHDGKVLPALDSGIASKDVENRIELMVKAAKNASEKIYGKTKKTVD